MLDRRHLAPHALATWATRQPDVVALEHVDGDRVTYAALHREALTWAGALRRIGVDAGTHVATLLPNIFDAHRTLLGLAWLRAIDVPINTGFTGSMLRYALDLADGTVVVTTSDLAQRLEPELDALAGLETVVVVDTDEHGPLGGRRVVGRSELLDGAAPADDLDGPEHWDVAALLFTSGTTGPSKAVVTPWAVMYQNWSYVPADALAPGEGLFCPFPLFHNSGRGAFNCALDRGARLVIRDRFSATHVWDDVRRTDCAAMALVGPLTALLYRAEPLPDDADNPVRSVVLGPMIPEIEDFERRFGVRTCVAYGQTEVGVVLCSDWDHGPAASCGSARDTFPWPEVRIVDEHDQPVPVGTVGELIVRTAAPWGLNAGYHKMPVETALAWRNGWFHTGDALRCDADGYFYFVDRLDDAIRRRGENISSFEVEKLVCEHPAVAECAAIGVDTELGDQEILVALILADPDSFDPGELIRFLSLRMPRFMVPRYVEVVDELPRTEASARVRKHRVRERGLSPRVWDRDAAASSCERQPAS